MNKDKDKDNGGARRGASEETSPGYIETGAEAGDTDAGGDLDENGA